MATATATPRRATESGVPDNKQYMHPTLLENYGNWKYHDRPRPGVLHHVSHSGGEVTRPKTSRWFRRWWPISARWCMALSPAMTGSPWRP